MVNTTTWLDPVYENESLSKLIGLCRAIISVSRFLVRVASAYLIIVDFLSWLEEVFALRLPPYSPRQDWQ